MPEPLMYSEIADWWPLLSRPEEYEEEAGFFTRTIIEASDEPPRTILELGSGGGNNASYMKAEAEMTLVDLAPNMLEVSKRLNPECEHIVGDMRTVRLGREFDAVFIHDAIDYMTSAADLAAAVQTAFAHTRAGGVAMFCPDHIRETFKPSTEHGGSERRRPGVCAICSGPGTRIRGTPSALPTTPTSCGTATEVCASCTIATSAGCSEPRSGLRS
jgi:SAM-dependent methyltransferase